jgi:hypothetical protein
MANYVLTYDLGTTYAMHEQLTAFVKLNRHVNQWAQPFMGCYLLKSDIGLFVLNASFAEFFAQKTLFMIAEIDPNKTSGLLSPAIWTWLNQPETNALSGLLGSYLNTGIAPEGG